MMFGIKDNKAPREVSHQFRVQGKMQVVSSQSVSVKCKVREGPGPRTVTPSTVGYANRAITGRVTIPPTTTGRCYTVVTWMMLYSSMVEGAVGEVSQPSGEGKKPIADLEQAVLRVIRYIKGPVVPAAKHNG